MHYIIGLGLYGCGWKFGARTIVEIGPISQIFYSTVVKNAPAEENFNFMAITK